MSTRLITPLVPVDRERFLRQEETKIRSAASNALAASSKPDFILQQAYDAVLYCEDLLDRHEIAVDANRRAGRETMAKDHERFAAMATQLKLRSLDQLSHVVGY